MDKKTRLVKNSGIELVNIINEAIEGGAPERDFLSRLLELYEYSLLVDAGNPGDRLRDLIRMCPSKKVDTYKNTIFNSFAVSHRLVGTILNDV